MSEFVSAPDIHGELHDVAVETLSWRPSAYGIVIKDGALLVSPQQNGYDLPGGGVELGELPEEAVLREIKEETGIDAINPRIIACASNYFVLPRPVNPNVQSILLYYVCDYVGGELSDSGFVDYEKTLTKFPEWIPAGELDTKLADSRLGSSYDWRPHVKKLLKR